MVSCSLWKHLQVYLIFTLGIVLINVGVGLFLFIKNDSKSKPETSIPTLETRTAEEAAHKSWTLKPLKTLQLSWGVLIGVQPMMFLYFTIQYKISLRLFYDQITVIFVILCYLVFLVFGVGAGYKLWNTKGLAKLRGSSTGAHSSYNEQVDNLAAVAGKWDLFFKQFDWMSYQMVFTTWGFNLLAYMEPLITLSRNILLVVFVFVCHKNSVSQHYWILGLSLPYEIYLIYLSFSRNWLLLFFVGVRIAWQAVFLTFKLGILKALREDSDKLQTNGNYLLYTTVSIYFIMVPICIFYLFTAWQDSPSNRRDGDLGYDRVEGSDTAEEVNKKDEKGSLSEDSGAGSHPPGNQGIHRSSETGNQTPTN